jgi:hypothetical protein
LFPCLQNHRNLPFLNWLCMSTHSIWWSKINRGQQPGCSLGGTPSLPYCVAPPIKPPTHSSQAATPWTRGSAQQSVLPINLSFLYMLWSLFSSSFQQTPVKHHWGHKHIHHLHMSLSNPFVIIRVCMCLCVCVCARARAHTHTLRCRISNSSH